MKTIQNIVVMSDTHFGCKLGLCPPKILLDEGGLYVASLLQRKMYKMWEYFFNTFVPEVTKGEKYILVHNGDIIDGVHHKSTSQITHNLKDQRKIAMAVMLPIIKRKECVAYYQVRGTEAHVGKSAEDEEEVAKDLGAEPDELGNHSRWELWLRFGKKKLLVHFTHHIGSTNSASYESTAPHKELIEAYVEAGKMHKQPPDCIVRSHRHRFYQNIIPSKNVNAISVITPCWQLKTPYTYKGVMGRSSTPQIGGIIIREGEEVPIYVRQKIWNIERSKEVVV